MSHRMPYGKRTVTAIVTISVASSAGIATKAYETEIEPGQMITAKGHVRELNRYGFITLDGRENGTDLKLSYIPYEQCKDEDGPGPCIWRGWLRGNGTGRTYIVEANGTIRYLMR